MADLMELLHQLDGVDFLDAFWVSVCWIIEENMNSILFSTGHGFDASNLVYAAKIHLEQIITKNLLGKLCAFEYRLHKWQDNQVT